jgi:hypothetical protein
MNESESHGEPLPFDHADVADAFETALNVLVSESDRGAVLVGASVVDNLLRKLFEHTVLASLNKETRKKLFNYPGVLSTFAARADIAYATRLIDRNTYKSIHILRKIRNDVAHSPASFSLDEYRERISELTDEGVGAVISEISNVLSVNGLIDDVMKRDAQRDPEERLFINPQEILDHLAKQPEITKSLREKSLRGELGIAIGMTIHGSPPAANSLDWQGRKALNEPPLV